jgi:tRNA(fMet)-specific endonuclease VapC
VDYILDTDHLTIVQTQSRPGYDRIQEHLRAQPDAILRTTIVSFQEHVQGWLAYINRVRDVERVLLGYGKLMSVLRDYCQASILPFDRAAQDRFAELRALHLPIGTMDQRIASIALAAGATLLTRNLRDFRKVPHLRVEDWTE